MIKQYIIVLVFAVLVLFSSNEIKAEKSDLSLDSFIEQVWKTNPVLQEAEARILAAEAEQKAASRWQYNPEIEYAEEDVDKEKKTRVVTLSQTIDWNGKAKASGVVTGFELNAVKAEFDDIKQIVTINILSSLSDYNTAQNILNLSMQRIELMKKFVDLAKNSYKAGDIDKSEYNLAQLAFSEALIVQADAEMIVTEARQNLETAIGSSLGYKNLYPTLPETLPELDSIISEEKLVMALPAIRALIEREQASKAGIKQAKKNRLADPSFGISGGKDTGSDMIGFSVSMPLNIFNSYAAEVDVAKQNYIAQGKTLQTALYFSKTKLQSSYRNYSLSKKAWENWSNAGAGVLANQIDILNRKFKIGELSATDYLVQVKQALSTEQASEELHGKTWSSWFLWLSASGQAEQWIKNLTK